MSVDVIGGTEPAPDPLVSHMRAIPIGREMPFPHAVNPYASIRSAAQKLNGLGMKLATYNNRRDQFTIVRRFG